MPLLDHFHPPLAPRRRWESFHTCWATSLASHLNKIVLPPAYYAEMQVHIGGRIEVDVGALEGDAASVSTSNGPRVATMEKVWAPPSPPLVLATVFPDEIEVQIFGSASGVYLVGAIELISPGNKDRPEARQAFTAKCSSYLQVGVGLIILDVVTDRLANMHNELMDLLEQPERTHIGGESLYGIAYRPARRPAGDQIDCWPELLAVGQPLPILPLALRGGPTLPVDLELTYMEARGNSRL
jgi:Protein of unknown function (DUF4058)